MPPIDPDTVYTTASPTSLSQTNFNTQRVLDSYESVLDTAPYDTQKNINVFFFGTTLFELMGVSEGQLLSGIVGVNFHFAKDGSDLALIARSANAQGATPVIYKDKNLMSSPSSGQKTVTAREWCNMVKGFYNDNFAMVKNKTTHSLTFTSTDLLKLFSQQPYPNTTRTSLVFHLIFSQLTSNWYLNLGTEKNPSTSASFAYEGDECPPKCYPDTLSSVIQNLDCSIL